MKTYSLVELRTGTGFPKGARFALVEQGTDVVAAVERALPELDPAPAFGQSYRCARCSDLMPKPPEPHLYCVKCSRADADRLDDLETNCWGLKAFAIPDTDGDGDEFGWKVVQQRTHGGRDVVIATEHSDDLRAAIDAASGVDRGDSYHG